MCEDNLLGVDRGLSLGLELLGPCRTQALASSLDRFSLQLQRARKICRGPAGSATPPNVAQWCSSSACCSALRRGSNAISSRRPPTLTTHPLPPEMTARRTKVNHRPAILNELNQPRSPNNFSSLFVTLFRFVTMILSVVRQIYLPTRFILFDYYRSDWLNRHVTFYDQLQTVEHVRQLK